MLTFFILIKIIICSSAFGIPLPHENLEEYIVGGRPTDIKEVPYQIALLVNGSFTCGGSILSATHILTAAHCVADCLKSPFSVRAGSSNKTADGVLIPAKNIFHHSKFSYDTYDYDIAVVELSKPLKFGEKIKAIKIGEKEPEDAAMVKASGWGCLKENGTRPTQLQSVEVPMVNRKTCEKNYKKLLPITRRMICAGVEGKDACQGDSGGPLVYGGKLVGVVSWGNGCARKEFPGVYTNLADDDMRKFIKQYVNL